MLHLVSISTPPDQAASIAKQLVEERLAACAQIIPEIKSIYHWKDQIEEDTEALVLLKVPEENLERLYQRVPEIHPYEVPEIIALPIQSGLPAYLTWAADEAKPTP